MAEEGNRGRHDPAALRAGYEQLRERVLAGRPDGWELGHAVLVRRGLAGWVAARAALAPTTPATTPAAARAGAARAQPDPPGCSGAGGATRLPGAGEIVAVLSEMALAHAA